MTYNIADLTGRMLAGQQGCEMTIMDSDSDLRPPDVVTPTPAEVQGRVALHSKLYSWTILHGRVVRLLKDAPFLSEEEIEKLEERIQAQYEKMPTLVSYNADASLNPGWYLDCHIFVDNTKLRVFRNNLTPNAPYSSRLTALRRCVEMAMEASPRIAEKFVDFETSDVSPEEAHEHNQRVVRIIFPEHCQYLYSCAMYLFVAKLWSLALPFVIGLCVIGNKVAINKYCCRYLWGVINYSEGKDPLYPPTQRESGMEGVWSGEEEELLALIAADMHQDPRAWDTVWQKDDGRNPRTLEASSELEEQETEQPDDSPSISEISDLRSPPKTSEADLLSVPSAPESRSPLIQRWSEDETWDSMIAYVRAKCEEQNQMEDVKTETDDINIGDISIIDKGGNYYTRVY